MEKVMEKHLNMQIVMEINWKNRDEVLEAVKQNGGFHPLASKEFKGDKELIKAAVSSNGDALEYASNDLRNDKEIVYEAIKQSAWAIKFASEELKAEIGENDPVEYLVKYFESKALSEKLEQELPKNLPQSNSLRPVRKLKL